MAAKKIKAMARYIYCEKCDNKMKASAIEFGELYESIEGIALRDMFCDGACGGAEATQIEEGDKCFAAVLLDSKSHPNYESQKPSAWANQFIKTSKT